MSYSTSYRSINKLVINDLVFKTARALSLHFEKKDRKSCLKSRQMKEKENKEIPLVLLFLRRTHARRLSH